MRKIFKYIIIIGAIAVVIAYYVINGASDNSALNQYQYYNNIPAQGSQTVDDQGKSVPDRKDSNNQNSNNNQSPDTQLTPAPYMKEPGMVWGNFNYKPSADNQSQVPTYGSFCHSWSIEHHCW